jgi:NAD(P) transhydrogenase subunit alpha
MKTGSCIIDLAAENGGNCELTQPGDIVNHDGVTIDGRLNLPSQVPHHASQMLSKNIAKLLGDIIKEGEVQFDMENEIVKGCLLTHKGQITHEMTRNIIEGAK